MKRTLVFLLFAGLLLAACAPTPASTPTASPPTVTPRPPTPTPTPAPTPTPTPLPPLVLAIHWPTQVSALQAIPVEVALIPPAGLQAEATVTALVLDDQDRPYQMFRLQPQTGSLYVAPEPLQLPLTATGEWRLVVTVHTPLEVSGERSLTFQPRPLRLRDLSTALPAGVTLAVPENFTEASAEGDTAAGRRRWRYRNEELSLAWAPGPTEPLLLNNALALLEATYDPQHLPQVGAVKESTWQERPAFVFEETWPGSNGGPGRAWVMQGPDYRLYVLRVKVEGRQQLTPLLLLLAQTFQVENKR